MSQANDPSITNIPDLDEPAERLEQRALDGVDFGIASLKRLRKRLPEWLRPAGTLDTARALAVAAAVITALAFLSPIHLGELAKRIASQLAGRTSNGNDTTAGES